MAVPENFYFLPIAASFGSREEDLNPLILILLDALDEMYAAVLREHQKHIIHFSPSVRLD